MLLKIITASTRPGRKGPALTAWIEEVAKVHGKFDVQVIDLAEVNLPFVDEPHHPRFQKYEHEHTKAWSKVIGEADAFIFVTPEYNYGYPATLKNALDYLYHEWTYKAVSFVSYGGLSAGTRSIQMLKQVLTAMKMMPVPECVSVPFFHKFITDDERFQPDEMIEKSAHVMLDELHRWTEAMQPLRAKETAH